MHTSLKYNFELKNKMFKLKRLACFMIPFFKCDKIKS